MLIGNQKLKQSTYLRLQNAKVKYNSTINAHTYINTVSHIQMHIAVDCRIHTENIQHTAINCNLNMLSLRRVMRHVLIVLRMGNHFKEIKLLADNYQQILLDSLHDLSKNCQLQIFNCRQQLCIAVSQIPTSQTKPITLVFLHCVPKPIMYETKDFVTNQKNQLITTRLIRISF